MSIPEKRPSKPGKFFVTDFPSELPQLPEELMEATPRLREWQDEANRRWGNFIEILNQSLVDLQQEAGQEQTDVSGLEESVEALQEQASSLSDQIGQLQELLSDLPEGFFESLQEHIEATIVHGTESNVVGESDEGILERKRIGEDHPRHARFLSNIVRSSLSDVLTIPAGYQMVVDGPYEIEEGAVLTVEGKLTVI